MHFAHIFDHGHVVYAYSAGMQCKDKTVSLTKSVAGALLYLVSLVSGIDCVNW